MTVRRVHCTFFFVLCGVSVKSMAVLESVEQLRLLIASSDGYIKLYDVSIEVRKPQQHFLFVALIAIFTVISLQLYDVHYQYYSGCMFDVDRLCALHK